MATSVSTWMLRVSVLVTGVVVFTVPGLVPSASQSFEEAP
jgi:hypothetical protein